MSSPDSGEREPAQEEPVAQKEEEEEAAETEQPPETAEKEADPIDPSPEEEETAQVDDTVEAQNDAEPEDAPQEAEPEEAEPEEHGEEEEEQKLTDVIAETLKKPEEEEQNDEAQKIEPEAETEEHEEEETKKAEDDPRLDDVFAETLGKTANVDDEVASQVDAIVKATEDDLSASEEEPVAAAVPPPAASPPKKREAQARPAPATAPIVEPGARPRVKRGCYTEEQLEAALQKQLRAAGLPDYEMRLDVINYAQDKSCKLLLQEDYDGAAQTDQAVDIMRASMQNDRSSYDHQVQDYSMRKRLESANEQQQEINEKWERKIAEFREQGNEKIAEMENRHEEERQEFQQEWSKPEALIPFSKPSPTLLQLKKKQKSLAITHDYQGAKQLKEECERLAKEESEVGCKRASEAMRNSYNLLAERQKKEIDCFVDHGKQQIMRMEAQRDAELRANENLRKRLQSRLSMHLPMNKKPAVTIPRVQRPARSATGTISEKTRRQLNTYKKSSEKTRLDIKLMDLNKIMMKPSTAVPQKPSEDGQPKPSRL